MTTERLRAAGLPLWALALSPTLLAPVADWASRQTQPLGLVLFGSPGTGKTVQMTHALRGCIEAGVGRAWDWDVATDPRVQSAIAAGRLRRRFPPVWRTDWVGFRDLFLRIRSRRELTDDREPWTESECRAELEQVVSVFGVDDFDLEQPLPRWMEALGVWVAERPLYGQRIILVVNAQPETWSSVLGERVADRLLDSSRFVVVDTGTTSRRH